MTLQHFPMTLNYQTDWMISTLSAPYDHAPEHTSVHEISFILCEPCLMAVTKFERNRNFDHDQVVDSYSDSLVKVSDYILE